MATCLSWAKPSEQPLHLIWWVKRTLHSRVLLRATLAWSHGPSPPTPPPPLPHTHTHTHTHTNGELARRLSSLNKRQWSQEWILSFLIHETGLIEKPSYKRNLNRALLINLRQPRWRHKKCCWMPPYLTVSYTSLSSEAHWTPGLNSPAWPVHYTCAHQPGSGSHGQLPYSCFGEEETENELHQASFADVYACRQLLFRYTLP